jgi:hypothetical protein
MVYVLKMGMVVILNAQRTKAVLMVLVSLLMMVVKDVIHLVILDMYVWKEYASWTILASV